MATINEIIVYQNNLLFPFSRQCGCHTFHGRLNMALRILLTIQAIGEPQLGQAIHPGEILVPQEHIFGALGLSPPAPSTAF